MMQVVNMTDKEKLKMYMKLSKKELAKMLVNANNHIDMLVKWNVTTDSTTGTLGTLYPFPFTQFTIQSRTKPQ